MNRTIEKIILVDKKDSEIGFEEKMKVHKNGQLHRAFSIFVFNSKSQLMLQKRANNKYHSGGLWTNTCCSHPRLKEKTETATHRRLKEEMGFDCELKEVFSFIYKVKLDDLTEYEYDHVFIGNYDEKPNPNPVEVEDWQWISMAELNKDLSKNPSKYTHWFKIAIKKLTRWL